LGRAAIRCYDTLSPPLAARLAGSHLSRLVRVCLLEPLARRLTIRG
jgi:hypothetical protein